MTLIEAIYDYLDRTPTAVVLLDEQRRVIYANARAAGLQQRKDGIRLTHAGIGLSRAPDLKSAAREIGVTYGTARARLAEIFQKTDTRRQGELINLVLTTLELR
jgi:hypothetical protein